MSKFILPTLLFSLLLARPAHSKDFDFEYSWVVSFVNMTPDAASDKASQRCTETLRTAIDKNNWQVNFVKVGETKARKLAKMPRDGAHFMKWDASKVSDEGWIPKNFRIANAPKVRFLLFVDCRPTDNVLDIRRVAIHSGDWETSVSIHHAVISNALVRAVSKRVF